MTLSTPYAATGTTWNVSMLSPNRSDEQRSASLPADSASSVTCCHRITGRFAHRQKRTWPPHGLGRTRWPLPSDAYAQGKWSAHRRKR
jgi:hypothetical protein